MESMKDVIAIAIEFKVETLQIEHIMCAIVHNLVSLTRCGSIVLGRHLIRPFIN